MGLYTVFLALGLFICVLSMFPYLPYIIPLLRTHVWFTCIFHILLFTWQYNVAEKVLFLLLNFCHCISSHWKKATIKTVFSRVFVYLRLFNSVFTQKSYIIWSSLHLWLSLADLIDKNENLALPSLNSRLKLPRGGLCSAGRGNENYDLCINVN